MTSLDQFSETIAIDGKPIAGGHMAYKMDSTAAGRNMRGAVHLGTCHCCDYFLARDDSIVLIEETKLLGAVEGIRADYAYLKEKDLNDHMNKLIRDEMQLKAYGAMLVLCRLAQKCAAVKNLIQGKKYDFWLVASATDSPDAMKLFDNIKDSLREKLKGVLGAKLLDNVEVIPSKSLEKRLADDARAR